jgi:hypothetical protein
LFSRYSAAYRAEAAATPDARSGWPSRPAKQKEERSKTNCCVVVLFSPRPESERPRARQPVPSTHNQQQRKQSGFVFVYMMSSGVSVARTFAATTRDDQNNQQTANNSRNNVHITCKKHTNMNITQHNKCVFNTTIPLFFFVPLLLLFFVVYMGRLEEGIVAALPVPVVMGGPTTAWLLFIQSLIQEN